MWLTQLLCVWQSGVINLLKQHLHRNNLINSTIIEVPSLWLGNSMGNSDVVENSDVW